MKIVRTLLLVAVVASSFVVMAATQAFACSCVPPRPDDKAVKDAEAVFTGTMVDSKVKELGFSRAEWTFAVDTVYKGDVSARQVVHSHTQSSACGLVFDKGKRYAVFAYEGDPSMAASAELSTNSCMNTRPLDESKELKLKPVRAFAEDSGIPHGDVQTQIPLWQLVLGAIAFVAVILGVLAVFRRS